MLGGQKGEQKRPETAVVATILIRLRAAIDSVEDLCAKVRFAFAFLRFDFRSRLWPRADALRRGHGACAPVGARKEIPVIRVISLGPG